MKFVFPTPIEYLRLPERTYHALLKAKIENIGDLLEAVEKKPLSELKGIGEKGEKAIRKSLEGSGFTI